MKPTRRKTKNRGKLTVQNTHIPSRLSRAVRQHRRRPRPLPALLPVAQYHPLPLGHRVDDPRERAYWPRPRSLRATRGHPSRRVPGQPHALQGQNPSTTQAANRGLDQSTQTGDHHQHSRSFDSNFMQLGVSMSLTRSATGTIRKSYSQKAAYPTFDFISCRSQSQFDIDHMRQSNFDQDT